MFYHSNMGHRIKENMSIWGRKKFSQCIPYLICGRVHMCNGEEQMVNENVEWPLKKINAVKYKIVLVNKIEM